MKMKEKRNQDVRFRPEGDAGRTGIPQDGPPQGAGRGDQGSPQPRRPF